MCLFLWSFVSALGTAAPICLGTEGITSQIVRRRGSCYTESVEMGMGSNATCMPNSVRSELRCPKRCVFCAVCVLPSHLHNRIPLPRVQGGP